MVIKWNLRQRGCLMRWEDASSHQFQCRKLICIIGVYLFILLGWRCFCVFIYIFKCFNVDKATMNIVIMSYPNQVGILINVKCENIHPLVVNCIQDLDCFSHDVQEDVPWTSFHILLEPVLAQSTFVWTNCCRNICSCATFHFHFFFIIDLTMFRDTQGFWNVLPRLVFFDNLVADLSGICVWPHDVVFARTMTKPGFGQPDRGVLNLQFPCQC